MLIIGLGNPGRKYKNTRHNVGFQVVDKFREKSNFPEFKLSKKFGALISEDISGSEKIILTKPQTFMNQSGKAIKKLTSFYKTTRPGLVVIHDDIDLPLGKIRIVKNRGSAGHKGVESIIREMGTKNFVRFRVGIQPKRGKPKEPEKFVLREFNKEETGVIKKIVGKSVEAIEMTLKQGLEKSMSKYNK